MKKNCLSSLFYISCFFIQPIKGMDNLISNYDANLACVATPTQRLINKPPVSHSTQSDLGFIAESQGVNAPNTRRKITKQGTRRNLNVSDSLLLLANANVLVQPSISASTKGLQGRKILSRSVPTRCIFDVQKFIELEYGRMAGVFLMQEPRSLTNNEVADISLLAENLRNLSLQQSTQCHVIHSSTVLAYSEKLIISQQQTNQGIDYTVRLRPQNILQKPFNISIYLRDSENGQTIVPLHKQEIPLVIEGMQIYLETLQGGLPTFWNNLSLAQYLGLRGALTYMHQRSFPLEIVSRLRWSDCSPRLLSVIRFIYLCYRNELERADNLTLPVFMKLYEEPIQTTFKNQTALKNTRKLR